MMTDRLAFIFVRPSSEVNCDDVPFATLMDILTCRKVRKKFRCVVRFVAAIPWRVEDFCSPRGTYRVRFTVEDPTARIHAFAYAEDGEKFFDGYLSADVLSSKLNKLLGVAISVDGKEIKDAARNPPWVQCCLISHYLKCCKICDTKLVGQQV
ncbi:protection of telomeres protein 1b-like isoform X3 [Herrania umbratica]|uniref:Protection of telomeres protein 1b-like isoform X3 n=1 Tax=Herrania umbratica TaxID=108875 RepID=A0A6J1AYK7_9ROSI|nr:protection of telomeres protein 1b-like isoform X3 [Herrania umbratica]